MAAAVVGLADRAGRALAARERVEQRGLADAGGAEQHAGDAGAEQRGDGVEPVPSTVETGSTGAAPASAARTSATRAAGSGSRSAFDSTTSAVGGRVGGEREHALDAADAQLAVHRRDDDHEVDVGGEHLRLAAVVRRAHERAASLATAWTAPDSGS